MSLQQFQSDEPLPSDAPLRAQRMTADEAASVIALWQQEQTELTGLTDRPAVPDVAESLDISVVDVQRLLQAVRVQRLAEENALAEEKRRLAEIQRQQAELRQEQGTSFWHISDRKESLPPQIETSDFLRGFLPGFVAIVVVILIVLLATFLTHPNLPTP